CRRRQRCYAGMPTPGAVTTAAAAIEALECPAAELRFDRAGVAQYADPARAVITTAFDGHGRAPWGVLERVLDQVVEDRGELRLAGPDGPSAVLVQPDLV